MEFHPIDDGFRFSRSDNRKQLTLVAVQLLILLFLNADSVVSTTKRILSTANEFDISLVNCHLLFFYLRIFPIPIVNYYRCRYISRGVAPLGAINRNLSNKANISLLPGSIFRIVYFLILHCAVISLNLFALRLHHLARALLAIYNMILWTRIYTSFENINLIYPCVTFNVNNSSLLLKSKYPIVILSRL